MSISYPLIMDSIIQSSSSTSSKVKAKKSTSIIRKDKNRLDSIDQNLLTRLLGKSNNNNNNQNSKNSHSCDHFEQFFAEVKSFKSIFLIF